MSGSVYAVIVPGLFSVFGIFLLRSFMHQIPDELREAAQLLSFRGQYYSDTGALIAGACVAAVPIIPVFLVPQLLH